METTVDGILNRSVMLEQPKTGYRVAIDTVLLASAVPAVCGQKVLELGCGVGGAMLALARRIQGIPITGIEIQPDLARLCAANIARNAFAVGCEVIEGDATNLPDPFIGAFDHVMLNPPYHEESSHDASPNAGKRTANTENHGDLSRWIASAAKALRAGGTMTLIHRADRMDDIVSELGFDFGNIQIKPIAPKQSLPAKRIIVRAQKSAPISRITLPPLIMHDQDGSYTTEADGILRDVATMEF